MKFYSTAILLLFVSVSVISQTGPGGVGSNDGTSSLKIWYRPDFGISTSGPNIDSWANGAGIAAHDMASTGANRPSLNTGAVNGYDELNFNGNDYMQITGALSTTNFIVDEASSFVVTKRNGLSNNWVYATTPHQTDRFSCHISWGNGNVYYDIGGCCGTQSRLQVNGLTGLNNYSYWSYDAMNATGKQIYKNGSLQQSRANTQTYTSHASHSFRIGEQLNGNLTEVIIFRQKVNIAQRLIVENYLSAKYNVAAASNDIYDEDDNGDFDHDVAGIGRINDVNYHDDSQGTGIVRVLNPTNLDDSEFLFWGHDNGLQQAIEVTDIPASIQARFERIWRASEVNLSGSSVNVGAIDMRFDLTNLGAINVTDLRLLVDTDNDGVFIDETPISGAVSLGGNIYEFAGITAITDNRRFTLATINVSQTPLPVELESFTAELIANKKTHIKWKTASEVNSDFFMVQKSKNGFVWEDVIQVGASGNSPNGKNYNTFDHNPYEGTSYYRLKQVDFNGQYTLSEVVAINVAIEIDPLKIYPNPTENSLTILGLPDELQDVRIYTVLGQDVTALLQIAMPNETTLNVDLSVMKSGIYIVKTLTSNHKIYKK